MGPIHTPRTLYAIAKGLTRRRSAADGTAALGGMGEANPFVTHCRAGLFDCDYQMHMNNAAYLSHAEYARWELCAYNGLMQNMMQTNTHFMVGSTAIRFRREIRPIFRQFEVHSFVARIDERYLWVYHTFRYPPGGKDPGRIRAQAVCQGLAVRKRQVLDPREYLKDEIKLEAGLIDEMSATHDDSSAGKSANYIMEELMEKYSDMDAVLKQAAAQDDEAIASKGS